MSAKENYESIVRHYVATLEEHGQGYRAVDWKSAESAATRYDVMLDLIDWDRQRPSDAPVRLLDFGCGLGGLLEHATHTGRAGNLVYEGLDIAPEFVHLAKQRFPKTRFHHGDVLAGSWTFGQFEYAVMNGVFTRRETLTSQEMQDYVRQLAGRVFDACDGGLALNFMSPLVDWEDPNLFYPPFSFVQDLAGTLGATRVILRNDYNLYEQTVYLYRNRESR